MAGSGRRVECLLRSQSKVCPAGNTEDVLRAQLARISSTIARFTTTRARRFALAALAITACTADSPSPTRAVDQQVINPPLPGNLRLGLHARTTVTVGAFSQINADVASPGLAGSVLFDVNATQGFGGFNVLANTVVVNFGASVGHIFGNDITVNGSAAEQSLGLDPEQLPGIPAAAPATPGSSNVTTRQNQARQLCPGQYGEISLGINSTLNLNGGVYHVARLSLADGARLEPSEPVVILVSGALTTGSNAIIRPSPQALHPMTAADIRLEVAGSVTLGDSSQVRAHILAPTGRLTLGRNAQFTGAAWADAISVGPQSFVVAEDALGVTPTVPPPCNDDNACTTDQCVTTDTVAFCRNTPSPTGTSCGDGNLCNGAETCDGAGHCDPGTIARADTPCPDGDVCNGDERCNGFGTCLAGSPLDTNDRNACTSDACDPVTGVSHDPVRDGTTCSGAGVCQAGVCSVSGTVFSEDFVQFQDAPAQCDRWNDFVVNRLIDGSYGRVTMLGTFDLTGVTCSNPVAATRICNALHDGAFDTVFCDGHNWSVGACAGMEVSIDFSVCACNFSPGHTVRPCTNSNWGGVNTETCGAPSQNMTVVCE